MCNGDRVSVWENGRLWRRTMVTAVQCDHTVYVLNAPEPDIKMAKRINFMLRVFYHNKKIKRSHQLWGHWRVPCVWFLGRGWARCPFGLWFWALAALFSLQGKGEGMGCPRPRRGPRGHVGPGRPDCGAAAAHQARTRGPGRARAGVACWGHLVILFFFFFFF